MSGTEFSALQGYHGRGLQVDPNQDLPDAGRGDGVKKDKQVGAKQTTTVLPNEGTDVSQKAFKVPRFSILLTPPTALVSVAALALEIGFKQELLNQLIAKVGKLTLDARMEQIEAKHVEQINKITEEIKADAVAKAKQDAADKKADTWGPIGRWVSIAVQAIALALTVVAAIAVNAIPGVGQVASALLIAGVVAQCASLAMDLSTAICEQVIEDHKAEYETWTNPSTGKQESVDTFSDWAAENMPGASEEELAAALDEKRLWTPEKAGIDTNALKIVGYVSTGLGIAGSLMTLPASFAASAAKTAMKTALATGDDIAVDAVDTAQKAAKTAKWSDSGMSSLKAAGTVSADELKTAAKLAAEAPWADTLAYKLSQNLFPIINGLTQASANVVSGAHQVALGELEKEVASAEFTAALKGVDVKKIEALIKLLRSNIEMLQKALAEIAETLGATASNVWRVALESSDQTKKLAMLQPN